jgi:putative spermidine/putrescine transport system permease protein
MSGRGAYLSPGTRVARAGLYAFGALVCAFLLLPILAIVPLSFNAGAFLSYPLSGVSLRWYAELFGSSGWSTAFRNSLIVALATTALATPLGTLAALGLARLTSALKPVLIALLLAPMFVPLIIVAVAVYYLFAPLGLAHSFFGLVIGHTILATPFVVIVVYATLRGFDVSLLRAAASLGAPPLTVLRRVLLPLIAPGVFAAAVFAFTTSFDEIVLALLLAGAGQKTLPLQMFDGIHDQISPAITAAATLLFLLSVLLLWVVELMRRRRVRMFRVNVEG